MQLLHPRILCVEDDLDTCEMLKLLLGLSGYEVVAAHTATEALKKSLNATFDLVLLDPGLPDQSGIELCKEIREVNPSTPIIFYSGEARPKQIEWARKAGAQAYLVKPVDPDKLERTIKKFLR